MTERRNEPWFWRSAEDFGRLRLENGSHESPDEGVCLMEAVAWLAREPHGDDPKCVCPVLGAFGRVLNDRLDVERRGRLKPLIPALVGTSRDGHAGARGFMAMDWIVRTYTPAWLRLAGLDTEADGLQSLPEIADAATLRGAQQMLDAARKSASARAAAGDAAAGDAAGEVTWAAVRAAVRAAAWDAAGTAAGVAAGVVAGVAAGVVAWDTVRVVAWDAAWAVAADAAGAVAVDAARAARDAAGAVLEPTKLALQDNAILLFRRMVERGAEERVVRPAPWATESSVVR